MADVDRREDCETRARINEERTQAATKAARAAAWRVGAIVFFALLSLLVGATIWQKTVNDRLDRATREVRETNARLDRSEMFACGRVQLQRERTNVGDARDYLLATAVAEAPRASQAVRDEYAGQARTARYDPPTDCREAVLHPDEYRRPASVPYVQARQRGERGMWPKDFARSVVRAAQQGRPQPQP